MKTPLLAAALAIASGPLLADTWIADPSHTEINVYYDHAGFSQQSVSFGAFEGVLDFTPGDIAGASAEFSVPVASVSSGNDMLDGELIGPMFFNGAEFPLVTFVSTGVEQTGEMTAQVTGDMTMLGQTNTVVFDVTVHALGEHMVGQFFDYYKGDWLGFTAEADITRSDWGMETFIPVGSDALRVVINTEMKKQE